MRPSARRALTSAALALLAGAGGGCPRPPRRAPVTPPPSADQEFRVGLVVGVPKVLLGGAGGGELLVSTLAGEPIGVIPADGQWSVLAETSGLTRLYLVKPDGGRAGPYSAIAATNVTEGRFAIANGRRYRGRLQVTAGRGGLTLVNRVDLESYVAGVVDPEIGPRRAAEEAAVLAQAVVSRTFAIRNRGRWESFGFDAYDDVRDQVYNGVAAETPQAWQAVRQTAGHILRYEGAAIDAFFHSTCGFSTAAVEEAFATARARPYLRPVSDARGGGEGKYYCDISPRFRWREEWDAPGLRAILTRTLPAVMPLSDDGLQRITGVEVTRTTRSGRVGELRIIFERGDVRIPGPQVRAILRPHPDRLLHSGAFQLSAEIRAGQVSRLVAAGAGSGHGVGMCQWGAIGRARAGQGYREILNTYFPGTKLERLY